MSQEALFAQIQEEIPGYAGTVVGNLDGSGYASHSVGDQDLAALKQAIPQMLRTYHEVYEGLGGPIDFGSNDELLMSATRGYLLVKVNHEKKRFVGVLLKSSGNLGYLRFRMRNYIKQAV
jgi:predicted regulator of Ras-like GTPase activity (Roadblock/LC7/MglB family)